MSIAFTVHCKDMSLMCESILTVFIYLKINDMNEITHVSRGKTIGRKQSYHDDKYHIGDGYNLLVQSSINLATVDPT